MKPITPDEAKNKKANSIHPKMIETVNDLLAKHYNDHTIVLKQEDIISEFLKRVPEYGRKNIFDNNQLDFERVFKKYGWNVSYDRPGYNETYSPSFEFRRKKKNNENSN